MNKCRSTGKVIFASLMEARIVMFNLKWGFKRRKDIYGKRIKYRQGKPDQCRAYYCELCQGYHITKWKIGNFQQYQKKTTADIEREVTYKLGKNNPGGLTVMF